MAPATAPHHPHRGTSRHLALRGAAAVVFGVFALSSADLTLVQTTQAFAGYALADGMISILFAPWAAETASRRVRRLQGILGAALACVAFLVPVEQAAHLPFVVGAWALVVGGFEVAAARDLRAGWPGERLGTGAGLITLALGLSAIVWPSLAAPTLLFLLGSYGLLFGIALLLLAYRLHTHHLRRQRALRESAGSASAP